MVDTGAGNDDNSKPPPPYSNDNSNPVPAGSYASSAVAATPVVMAPAIVTQVPNFTADMSTFQALVRRHELTAVVAQQLLDVLQHREIVLLCDDSSSMLNTVIEEGNDPFASNNSTRWQLLKRIAASIIDFVTSVSHHGLDLYFLKRPTYANCTSVQGLQNVFNAPPDEIGTPLISALQRIYRDKAGHRGLLIVVITDGEPNDGTRDDLRRVLLSKPSDCHVSFAECTDQEDDMVYLDQLKGQIPLFDNTDIYRLEAQRVKNLQGQSFKFDWTDYVIKILLATFIPSYWNLDQRKVWNGQQNYQMPQYSQMSAARPAAVYNSQQPQQLQQLQPPQQQQQPTQVVLSPMSYQNNVYVTPPPPPPNQQGCCVIL